MAVRLQRCFLILGLLLLALTAPGCGEQEGGSSCTVNCGRLGHEIDMRYYYFLTEEECAEKVEGTDCTARYCPAGSESTADCYDVPRE
jgi:hypothetical protein